MKWPFRRYDLTAPFAGARWAFWCLALTPSVLLFTSICNQRHIAYQFVFAAVLLMACLWEAHVRTMLRPPVTGWTKLLHVTRRGLFNLLVYLPWTFVVSIPAIVAVPAHGCYTDRARVSEALFLVTDLRNKIADNVRQTKAVEHAGMGLTVPRQGRVVGGMVSDNGTIFMVTEDPPTVIRFTPSISDAGEGAVTWACLGFPTRAMPAQCRE